MQHCFRSCFVSAGYRGLHSFWRNLYTILIPELCNPAGWKVVLFPRVAENQTICMQYLHAIFLSGLCRGMLFTSPG